jgi:hypothetical protein
MTAALQMQLAQLDGGAWRKIPLRSSSDIRIYESAKRTLATWRCKLALREIYLAGIHLKQGHDILAGVVNRGKRMLGWDGVMAHPWMAVGNILAALRHRELTGVGHLTKHQQAESFPLPCARELSPKTRNVGGLRGASAPKMCAKHGPLNIDPAWDVTRSVRG